MCFWRLGKSFFFFKKSKRRVAAPWWWCQSLWLSVLTAAAASLIKFLFNLEKNRSRLKMSVTVSQRRNVQFKSVQWISFLSSRNYISIQWMWENIMVTVKHQAQRLKPGQMDSRVILWSRDVVSLDSRLCLSGFVTHLMIFPDKQQRLWSDETSAICTKSLHGIDSAFCKPQTPEASCLSCFQLNQAPCFTELHNIHQFYFCNLNFVVFMLHFSFFI